MSVSPMFKDGSDGAVVTPHRSFEGIPVEGVVTQVTGSVELEAGEVEVGIDDVCRFLIEVRVTGVRHEVNKDGKLIRRQLVRVVDAALTPWVSGEDSGILRAHP